jgi:hypothetical protein
MKDFINEQLPEICKKILVIMIVGVPIALVVPAWGEALHIETRWGVVYVSHIVLALFLGNIINKIVQGVISLVVLSGVAYLFFEYGYQIQAALTRFSK